MLTLLMSYRCAWLSLERYILENYGVASSHWAFGAPSDWNKVEGLHRNCQEAAKIKCLIITPTIIYETIGLNVCKSDEKRRMKGPHTASALKYNMHKKYV